MSCSVPGCKEPYCVRNQVHRCSFGTPPKVAPQTEAQKRKGQPVVTGVLAYFPDAIKAVAEVSRVGNDQHNPGQPLHWDRSKSQDHLDCLGRHLIDHASGTPQDTDGTWHLAKAAWRALAALQLAIEAERIKT